MSGRLVLALDNSLDFLNVALAEEDRLIEERHARQDRHSSEVLPVRVRELLVDHGIGVKDLSMIIVTLGPGSFTGIRVGLAFCKGLAEGLHIPLIGVPTLDVLAAPFAFLDGYFLCPLLDAKKGEVFFAQYRVSEGKVIRTGEFQSLKPEDVPPRMTPPCLCFGTGVRLCRQELARIKGITLIDDGWQRTSGEAIIKTGLEAAGREQGREARPIYGRRSEAEIKFNVDLS
jgi:tRNA threonylcarbamoyladenosine biosynthesis protein TsaB